MELNINSPAYFSEQYGVDDEVYRYCRSLYAFFQDKEYSETLSVIGITPVIAPKEMYEGVPDSPPRSIFHGVSGQYFHTGWEDYNQNYYDSDGPDLELICSTSDDKSNTDGSFFIFRRFMNFFISKRQHSNKNP